VTHPAEKIHTSVLLNECMEYLMPETGKLYVDGTLGLGGHTEKILQLSAPEGRVLSFDWDEDAIVKATERLQGFGDRLQVQRRNFAEISEGLDSVGIDQIDGMMIDVGLSSLQLDMGKRGFSFQRDEVLDIAKFNGRATCGYLFLLRRRKAGTTNCRCDSRPKKNRKDRNDKAVGWSDCKSST